MRRTQRSFLPRRIVSELDALKAEVKTLRRRQVETGRRGLHPTLADMLPARWRNSQSVSSRLFPSLASELLVPRISTNDTTCVPAKMLSG